MIEVLEALVKVDSRLKLEKYKFRVKGIKFLGFIIRPREIGIDPKKIK